MRGQRHSREVLYTELGLSDPARSNEQLLGAMLAHTARVYQPFTVTPQGARLRRPAEVVREILPQPQRPASA